MIKKLFDNYGKKIISIYIVTTIIIYCFFWLGYYNLDYRAALILSVSSVTVLGILFAIFYRKTWVSLLFIPVTGAAIGLAMSSFFTAAGIIPSRFFGLVLLIMLGYKILQAVIGKLLDKYRFYKILFAVSLIAELFAVIIIGAVAFNDAPLLWQVFFALLLCFFYSCAQLALKKQKDKDFWRNVAISYLLGFVLIAVAVVLLIISMIAEDGSPFEALFEGGGGAIAGSLDAVTVSETKKQKKFKQ